MSSRLIIQIVFVVGLLTVLGWLFQLAIKFFIPVVIIIAGVYAWNRYFRTENHKKW